MSVPAAEASAALTSPAPVGDGDGKMRREARPALWRVALGAAGRAVLLSLFLALIGLLLGIGPVSAQDISINFGQSTSVSERAVQLVALITLLSIAPSIVVMVTSFTRIVVVLSLLRSAIGLQTAAFNNCYLSTRPYYCGTARLPQQGMARRTSRRTLDDLSF